MGMRICLLFAVLLAWAEWTARPAAAQFKKDTPDPTGGAPLGDEQVKRYRVGLTVTASGPCQAARATIPVPTDWPEQKVTVVEEDLSPQIRRVSYRMNSGTVQQMVVEIPRLNAGETAHAFVTVEVRRRAVLAPEDTSRLAIPDQVPADLRTYLAPSPLIESNHPRIKKLAAEIVAEFEGSDWQKVEKIYDWVRENVEYQNGPLKGALQGLTDGNGDCEELASLFIALCRANGVPARTVWVPGHCYPEFYLVDAEGQGHWFPCEAAGSRSFGGIADQRPILQKGDNFRDNDRPRDRLRYLSEFFTCKTTTGDPRVKFVRDEVTQ
jgi:vacuolar-type H+-ATPase subunit F/Vma7